MRARLQPFGTDFGNGAVDRRYFQRDDLEAKTLAAKQTTRGRYRAVTGPCREAAVHEAVLGWLEAVLAEERPDLGLPLDSLEASTAYAAVSDAVQEDFVVQLREPDGSDRAIAVYVCFPSGWRPEGILGRSFQRIHAAVPDFADPDLAARALVTAMVERGPYLRFVWTLVAHGELDRHPDDGPDIRFEPGAREGWLRVERQVSVPFAQQQAALFLIRTYLYPFRTLPPRQRATLAEAMRAMPDSTARYKGLEGRREAILEALAHA
jgi:hypothetical protein